MLYLIGVSTSTLIIPLNQRQLLNYHRITGKRKLRLIWIRTRKQNGIPPTTSRMKAIINISRICWRSRNATCVMRDSLSATNQHWTELTIILDTHDKMLNHVAVIVIDTSPIETN
jgi:hypothetical protein